MPVEIESILQHEDVQILLEATEASGTVRQSEINDLTETHEFDVFELDLLYRELETRGVEIVDDTRRSRRRLRLRRRRRRRSSRRPTRSSSSCARPAGTSC